MRAIGSITAAALAAGFLLAPFTHVHTAGAAPEHVQQDHSGSLALHFHVGSDSNGPALEALEESALQLDWFVLEELDAQELVAVLVEADGPPAPAAASPLTPQDTRVIHHPPGLSLYATRGPPA